MKQAKAIVVRLGPRTFAVATRAENVVSGIPVYEVVPGMGAMRDLLAALNGAKLAGRPPAPAPDVAPTTTEQEGVTP